MSSLIAIPSRTVFRAQLYRFFCTILVTAVILNTVLAHTIYSLAIGDYPGQNLLYYNPLEQACTPSSTPATTLTVEQKIGQLLFVGFDNSGIGKLTETTKKYNLGGVYLNIQDASKIPSDLSATSTSLPSDLLVGSDDEGGKVRRILPAGTQPSAKSLGQGSSVRARDAGKDAGAKLKAAGVNIVLGPVLDLDTGIKNAISPFDRSFSSDPNVVIEKAGAWTEGVVSSRVGVTLKHFPGIGSNVGNTDEQYVKMSKSLSSMTSDLLPYRSDKIKSNPSASVMLANFVLPEWGDDPVSVNAKAVEYLRNDIKFNGVIVTDDIGVMAKAGYGSHKLPLDQSVVKALKAGVTMPLFGYPGDAEMDKIISSVKSGVDSSIIDAALSKATDYKATLGLRTSGPASTPNPMGSITGVVDYKGNTIFTDADIKAINENKPYYENSAKAAQIPWEMLAVTHYRETRLKRLNPSNGQGVYQDYARLGGPYPAGTVSDQEFQRQTDWAAKFLKGKASGSRAEALANGDDNAVKYTFFAYNGTASAYVKQALSLGFSEEEAKNGEGSPYVMNKADEKRDPDTNPRGWGQIKSDGGSISYPANKDHGAFVMYAALRGKIAGGSTGSCAGGASSTDSSVNATIVGNLSEGGLSEEQAKRFMMNYGANKNGESVRAMKMAKGKPYESCNGGSLSNCVSFSAFFMNKFTNMRYQGGAGNKVVNNLKAIGVPTGTEPRLYAVFSNGFGTKAGHTGVILGIHGNKLIVGHASCSNPGTGRGNGTKEGGGAGFIKVGTVDTGVFLYRDRPTFAYPTTVNTEAIKAYVNQSGVI